MLKEFVNGDGLMINIKSQGKQNNAVFALAASVTVCFLLGSVLFIYNLGREKEKNSIEYLFDATGQRQAALNQQIEGDLQVLRGVAIGLAEVDLGDNELLLRLLDQVNRSNSFVRMGLADTDGIATMVDLDGTVYPDVDFSDMDFFQAALEGRDGLSGTLPSSATGLDVNYYAVPVYQGGNIAGALCAVNTDDILWDILDVPVFQGQGLFLVTDSEGIIVAPSTGHNPRMEPGYNITKILTFSVSDQTALLQTMAVGNPDSYSADMSGEDVIVTTQPLEHNDWYVLSIVPRAGITAYYSRTAIGTSVIVLAACLLFVLLLLWQKRMTNRSRESLETLAYTDTLTGVSNQSRFLLDANQLLETDSKKKYAVWSFDIKKFNTINDLFGVTTGDRILRQVASIFERQESADSAFCRVSADLFAGLRPYREKTELQTWVLQLWAELARQEIVPASKMHIESAMGLYCIEDYPEEQLAVSYMVSRASAARKQAKLSVGSEVCYFTRELSERARWEAELEASGREALSRGDITFFLQPKVNIQNGCVISGAEALARWEHPVHGQISPAEFIPLFEKNGFIVDLDRYIFEQACKWYVEECWEGNLAINVSRQGLLRADFLEFYTNVKRRYGIADGVLELEFTESMVLDDYELFQCTVSKMQRNGFMCSIDDFGSGYSSLNVLKNLTIDVLKLDAVFLRDGIDTVREQAVISNFIQMARQLGIKTVAEGVETSCQVTFLQHAGCDLVQGYYFSKPLSPIDFAQLMMEADGHLSPGME